MKKFTLNTVVTGLLVILITGCGGTSTENESATKILFDDPVAGMNYSCDGESSVSITTEKGEFTCQKDAMVVFSVGTYQIATSHVSAGTDTILRFADMNLSAKALADIRQLLQTLDQTPDDGIIKIEPNSTILNHVTVKPGDSTFDNEVENAIGKPLVDEKRAEEYAEESYAKHILRNKTWYVVTGSDIAKVSYNSDMQPKVEDIRGSTTLPEISWRHPKKISKIENDYVLVAVDCPCTNDVLQIRFYSDKEKAEAYANKNQ